MSAASAYGLADHLWTSAFAAWLRLVKTETRPGRLNRLAGRGLRLASARLPFSPGRQPEVRATAPLPRVVWMYWHDGEAAAPGLVRTCIASWRRLNPGWEVRVLDQSSAAGLAELSHMPADAGISHVADMLRVDLLARFGGVWADATCLCARPLDDWLPERMATGFFAFARPVPDREVASWFLAAQPGAPLVRAWAGAARACWSVRGRTDHYFVLHHLFEWMLHADPALRAQWTATPALPAVPPHHLQMHLAGAAAGGDGDAEARSALVDPAVPVHKLNWRLDDGAARLAGALSRMAPDLAAAVTGGPS